MKRPLAFFSVAFACGILISEATKNYIAIILITLTVFLAVYAVVKIGTSYCKYRCYEFYCSKIAIAVIFSGIVLGIFRYIIFYVSSESNVQNYCSKEMTVTGVVDELPRIKGEVIVYYLSDIRIMNDKGRRINGRIMIYQKNAMIDSNRVNSCLQYGDHVRIKLLLIEPGASRNPGTFNFKNYLAQKQVFACAYIDDNDVCIIGKNKGNILIKMGFFLRDRIVGTIKQSVKGQQGLLLNAMLIGYTSELGKEVEEAFRIAGLSHIMAVSGANIAFLVLPVLYVFKKFRIAKRKASIIAILAVSIFVLITGFEPSVERAAIMALVILSGNILFRETEIYTSIAFSALIMMIVNPMVLYNIGFQLSFAATLSLVMFYTPIRSIKILEALPKVISETLASTIAAQIGVLPISILCFNFISLVSLLTNIFVVPLTGIVTILGLAGALAGQIWLLPARLIGYINYILLSFILQIVKMSSSFEWSSVSVPSTTFFWAVLYYISVWYFIYYCYNKKISVPYTKVAASLFIFSFILQAAIMLPRKLEIVFLDVGEGDSCYIKTPSGKSILIDGGPLEGEKILFPFLLDSGVNRLDAAIITHAHADHVNGFYYILNMFKTDMILLPDYPEAKQDFEKILQICDIKNIPVFYCRAGDNIVFDNNISMQVMWPDEEDYSFLKGSMNKNTYLNNTSLVLKLSYKQFDAIFSADAELYAEKKMIENKKDLHAEILKAGHHGSKTSSCEEYIKSVSPVVGIVSVGKNNFGHPYKNTLDLLKDQCRYLLRTDESGAIQLKSDGHRIWIRSVINNPYKEKRNEYEFAGVKK